MRPAEKGRTYPIAAVSRLRMATDGKGIRTLILVSGCKLRCRYCINPFTWDGSRKARLLTAEDIWDRVRIDRPYLLATGGGITIGGGEPFLYPDLIRDLRDLCDSDMTIVVETSLYVPYDNIDRAADMVDHFYVDVKTMDEEIYKAYTGGNLNLVKENLERLLQYRREDVTVRIPRIPDFAGRESQLWSKEILQKAGARHFDLFDYER